MDKYQIKPKDQDSIMSSFWAMMLECEAKALDNNDFLPKVWVEGWYRQWNKVTGSSLAPKWVKT